MCIVDVYTVFAWWSMWKKNIRMYLCVCVCVYSCVNVCARVGILCACILCVCVCVGVWSLRVDRYCTAQSRKSQETA